MPAKFSLVCQIPGAKPYTIGPYTGTDLTQVIGICQADMPEGYFGWIQERGDAVVRAGATTQVAFVDFGPNSARLYPVKTLRDGTEEQVPTPNENGVLQKRYLRISQLPPLLIEAGAYCKLLVEARDVFVDGHFYACVAMCGISFERFQRDRATPYGAKPDHKMSEVRQFLKSNRAIAAKSLDFCVKMANLRNIYAHGDGRSPEEDALQALGWMRNFINAETSLMRGYEIVDGILTRK